MSYALYVAGYLIFTIGVALGAHYMHIHTQWIVVIVLILAGLGLARGVTQARQRDPS